jgi:hypothetical protein
LSPPSEPAMRASFLRANDRRRPLARSGAMGSALRERLASPLLRHGWRRNRHKTLGRAALQIS